jgi:hypothetical protein
VITSTEIIYYKQQPAYAHVLSSNENASLLEMFYKMRIEALLVQSNFPSNKTLAYEHAKNAAAELLNKNWTNVVADKKIVADLFSPVLNDLIKSSTESTTNNNSYEEIKGEVNALNNMLFEFVLLYLNSNNISYNSGLQALIIAEIANEINDKYGKAFGIIFNSSNMNMSMPMAAAAAASMHDNKNQPSMNTMNMAITENNTDNHTSTQTELLKSVVDYQTAQALTIQAQDILNKNLKPIAPMNATNANLKLEKDFDQLKNAIDKRAPFTDIMKIVHIQIHPILISTYKLQLKR